MDQTEISNNEYRQFVYYVRDSIARRLLSESFEEEYLIAEEDWVGYEDNGPLYIDEDYPQDPYRPLNWLEKDIRWDETDPEYKVAAMNDGTFPIEERFYGRKEVDARKLIYEYYRIDMRLAASKSNRYKPKQFPDLKVACFLLAKPALMMTKREGQRTTVIVASSSLGCH